MFELLGFDSNKCKGNKKRVLFSFWPTFGWAQTGWVGGPFEEHGSS
jgi:hypothetical protein